MELKSRKNTLKNSAVPAASEIQLTIINTNNKHSKVKSNTRRGGKRHD